MIIELGKTKVLKGEAFQLEERLFDLDRTLLDFLQQ
jgi:hypothetical protein